MGLTFVQQCVCVHVCMCVRARVCVYVCLSVCISSHIYIVKNASCKEAEVQASPGYVNSPCQPHRLALVQRLGLGELLQSLL